jgi:hypothetical protein
MTFRPHLTRPFRNFVRWLFVATATLARMTSQTFNRQCITRLASQVRQLCRLAGDTAMLDELNDEFAGNGLRDAVRHHDNGPIFDWLAETFSYQGVADAVATSYLIEHGTASFGRIERTLTRKPACPKLQSYWQFDDCGYRKSAQTCNEPDRLQHCPLPRLDLRNGNLNRASYSLWLFMRDVAGGDFVGWLDKQLQSADQPGPQRGRTLALAAMLPLTHLYGVSYKMISMTLSALLLAGDPDRERWQVAGANQIVVDTLIHNWLHRTGNLHRLKAEHIYGANCYRAGSCADILRAASQRIDARRFNADFPERFPRFVQHAVWQFCAQQGLNQCNGNQIDDKRECDLFDCPLYRNCDRRVLQPAPTDR